MFYSKYDSSRAICAKFAQRRIPQPYPPHSLPQNPQFGGCSRANRRANCNISAAVSHFLPTDAIVAIMVQETRLTTTTTATTTIIRNLLLCCL
jgi:hypothetical protein